MIITITVTNVCTNTYTITGLIKYLLVVVNLFPVPDGFIGSMKEGY